MTLKNRIHSNVITESLEPTIECCDIFAKTNSYKHDLTLNAPKKFEVIYINVLITIFYHLSALYGLYLSFTFAKTASILFVILLVMLGGFGITGGAHRLWSHKTYKAKLPLEYFIMLCNCLAYQQTVKKWVRDHRLHHKHSDTDADPHNARRGFFYSHIGWLMVRKNDLVRERGKAIDLSDIENNPVLKFQEKYAIFLFGAICFVLPTVIPILCWDESFVNAWYLNMFRYVYNLNASLAINSLAHIYGTKPYDSNILPTQNYFATICSGGEGFHNYHHSFPWDYRAAEMGNNYLNPTTKLLDFFAWMGWAYDLKTARQEMIEKKKRTTGDGNSYKR